MAEYVAVELEPAAPGAAHHPGLFCSVLVAAVKGDRGD